MPTYRLDPLHPDILVCECCGVAVAQAPAGLPRAQGLTGWQLALAARSLAALDAVADHEVRCPGRQGAGGVVYARLLPRNDEDGQGPSPEREWTHA
jgi:hypothetical protein